MSRFLDNFYGVLFNPRETFDNLKENPSLVQSFMIVFFISMLNSVLKFSFDSGYNLFSFLSQIMGSSFWGLLSWLFFAAFFELLAGIFKKGEKMKIFLCLSAFALLPWIFIAPASLFKTGEVLSKAIGILMGLCVWLWSTVLMALAIMKTYEISPARLITFILIPSFGGILSACWFVGFFTTLFNIVG